MGNCCICNKPLYHNDPTEHAQYQRTVLLYPDRPLSEAHWGCAADHHHQMAVEDALEQTPTDY